MKKFSLAGVSRRQGTVKVRFANDMMRVKLMVNDDQTDVNLLELPEAMDKGAAVKFLMTTELMETPDFAEAIENADDKYNSVPVVRATRKPKASTKPVATKEGKLASLRARVPA